MGELKEYIRKRQLHRHSFRGKTALRPLKDMRTAIVLLDVSRTGRLLDFRDRVCEWFFANGIRTRFFYLDFRKPQKNMVQLSAPADTLTLRHLSCFTRTPDLRKFNPEFLRSCDLFVSFVSEESYPLLFLSVAVPASFKIGSVNDPAYPYDLIIPASDPVDMFVCMKDILLKIS